jgi:hypothetical protein
MQVFWNKNKMIKNKQKYMRMVEWKCKLRKQTTEHQQEQDLKIAHAHALTETKILL